jgi:signal transduction histidine kinase
MPLAIDSNPLRAFWRIVADVPISDPIDRRNAPSMQLLFAVIAITLPISWILHFESFDLPRAMWVLAGADLVTVLASVAGIVLIRHGAFRMAVVGFLASLLLGLLLGHAALGYQANAVDQTGQMLSLALAGLVLGRRALWSAFAVLIGVFCVGFAVDAGTLGPERAFHLLPSAIFSYFVIVLVLDRCITALRTSLHASELHGQALQQEIDERERMQARLLHAQKMETVGRMASGIAHDFSNVLAVVSGYADARHRIDDIGDDPADVARDMAEALDGIATSAQRGTTLARRLLTLGRRDDANPVLLDAARLLAEMQPLLRRLLPRTIALELEVLPAALPVRIDARQFELVVLDIASNARDAMPEGGVLRMSARRDEGDAEIAFTDDGHGMSAEQVAQAFEPFYSTKAPGAGTGLGLATTHSVITGAGGTVSLDSVPGRGTTLRIRLPCVAIN